MIIGIAADHGGYELKQIILTFLQTLNHTVKDFGEDGGFGICFDTASVGDICNAIHRSLELYDDEKKMNSVIKHIMEIDHSWEKSAGIYINLYNS